MAQQQNRDTPTIGFRSIQLLKDQTLGIGSYGSVCKALCDDLLCAAKIIHPTLFDPKAHKRIVHRREHRLPIQRFMQECEFMSAIRHPNIVQFLGTHQDPQTGLPVLLMELMDNSLTHFLESSQDTIPYHIQVNFCHDITLAISYLHLNGITHRDLSSNNVLLHGNIQAKVSDFGMAKLGDINPQATRVSFTLCPGTDAYMPPEAVKDPPVYTEKIDCFAIGTLIIQILTRCFPKPGDRLKTIQIDHPQFPGGTVDVRASEIERRQNHISQVDPNHPLLPIALDCLKDSDDERPSAQELCHRIAALKETPQFRRAQKRPELATTEREEELRQQVQDKDIIIEQKEYIIQCKNDIIQEKNDIIRNKEQLLEAHMQQIQHDKDEEIDQMRQEWAHQIQELQQKIGKRLQQKEDMIQNKDHIIAASQQECQQLQGTIRDQQRQLQQVTQQLESSEQECQQLQGTIRNQRRQLQRVTQQLESSQQKMAEFKTRIRIQQLKEEDYMYYTHIREQDQKRKPSTEAPTKPKTQHHPRATIASSFTLRWSEGKKAPCKLARDSNAVVDGEMVYLRASRQIIYAYNSRHVTWEQLPDCLNSHSSLVVFKSCLNAIGGERTGVSVRVTNQLLSLTGEGSNRKWREVFPPMPTKRASSMVACTGQALIVAGGWGHDWRSTTTVEVMDINTKQWSSAADLPEPLYNASVTICREHVYYVGGWIKDQSQSGVGITDSRTTKSVYTCTLAHLFLSCLSRSPSHTSYTPSRPTTWSKVANLPVEGSTCVTFQDRLLAIGGCDSRNVPTSEVRIYHPTSDTWEVISEMKTRRRLCFAAVLPTNEIVVVGGSRDSVEIATVV